MTVEARSGGFRLCPHFRLGASAWNVSVCLVAVTLGCAPTRGGSTSSDLGPQPRDSASAQPVPQCQQPPSSVGEGRRVLVYFFCGQDNFPDDPVAVERRVPSAAQTEALLTATLQELFKGPTKEEQQAGFTSFFGTDTANMVKKVAVTVEGKAIIDFARELGAIPNISTSSNNYPIFISLEATVRQFKQIREVLYRLDGDRQAWCEIMQGQGCPEA